MLANLSRIVSVTVFLVVSNPALRGNDAAKTGERPPDIPQVASVGSRTIMRSDKTESKGDRHVVSETLEEEEHTWPLQGTATAQRTGKHIHVP